MTRNKGFRVAMASIALGVVFSQAHALDIVINAGATLAGNAAAMASFNRGAARWEALFTDNITVTINADMANLGGGGVIGSTGSAMFSGGFNTIRDAMVADAADEANNGIVSFLPTLAQFTATVPGGFSLDGNMSATKANLKALGFTGLGAGADATMTFNTQFAFNFADAPPPANQMDFETVVVHEIGHALGFVSDIDTVTSPVWPTTLDLFRFAPGNVPTTNGQFTTNTRMLASGNASFSDTINTWGMSTRTDGRQASHWKDNDLTSNFIGIMDPTLDFQQEWDITNADIRAFDLIGWDLQPVPEPATMVVLGIGALAMMRRKRAR